MTEQIRHGLGVLVVAALVAFVSLLVGTVSEDLRGLGMFLAIIAALIGLWQVAGGLLRSDPPSEQ